VVNLAFVSQETAGICEAWEFGTARDRAFVGTVVFIHVLSSNTYQLALNHQLGGWKAYTHDHSHFLPKSLTTSSHPGQLHT
jgi:hypothetical protein